MLNSFYASAAAFIRLNTIYCLCRLFNFCGCNNHMAVARDKKLYITTKVMINALWPSARIPAP